MKLDQLQPMQVQTMVNELLVDFKPKTVVNIIDVLSRLYKIAIANELVTKNPCSALELPKFDNQINFTMSKPKIHALVKVILNHRHMDYHGIFTFLLHGRRLGEVLNLEWSQIDFDSGIYEIPYIKNKARKNMRYILTDQLKTIIVRQLQHRTPSSPYVFTNPTTNTQYKSVSKAWKKIKEDAGIVQHMRIHDIRHLLGYYSVNFLNMPLEHVQQTLGHVDIKTTQRYVNDRPETSHKVMTTFFDSFNDP
jgi:integrase